MNVDELFEKRYGGKTARQYFEENESFTPIEMLNFAKYCIEQLHKPVIMQGLPSECLSKNKVCEYPMNSCEYCKRVSSPTVGKAGEDASV
jgi:hypothetical protein